MQAKPGLVQQGCTENKRTAILSGLATPLSSYLHLLGICWAIPFSERKQEYKHSDGSRWKCRCCGEALGKRPLPPNWGVYLLQTGNHRFSSRPNSTVLLEPCGPADPSLSMVSRLPPDSPTLTAPLHLLLNLRTPRRFSVPLFCSRT